MAQRCGVAAAVPGVVTAADMVAGHVTLDISCINRLYLNGYVPKLQTPGGVIYFFHDHRGKPIVSPALFEPIGEKFRKDMTPDGLLLPASTPGSTTTSPAR